MYTLHITHARIAHYTACTFNRERERAVTLNLLFLALALALVLLYLLRTQCLCSYEHSVYMNG